MHNIFIAVGGSGTRVAEALVRLLAVGFPTRNDNGILTSTGDSLQIWRVDPDRTSGAAIALQSCVDSYKDLQDLLGRVEGTEAKSRWVMDLDTSIRHLDPLQMARSNVSDQEANPDEAKTLKEILDSGDRGNLSSESFLSAFYEPKDLNVRVDKGFYQKPFIGAPVMGIFADSMKDANSSAGKEVQLTLLENREVRFFLCGSLHGGTGACGLPILGKFFHERKIEKEAVDRWSIGGCLLAPYCVPPSPPFKSQRGQQITDQLIEQHVRDYGALPAFSGLTPEEKQELVKQILQGFYADPEEIQARARQSLVFYKDHGSAYFDQLYLVGKPEPDELKVWSNGGMTQRNPLNSAEVVGAMAALNFFSGSKPGETGSYVIPSSTETLNSRKTQLYDLPYYKIGSTNIDPERVLLTTIILRHMIMHQIEWNLPAKNWEGIEGLREFYRTNEQRQEADRQRFAKATKIISGLMSSMFDPNESVGWDEEIPSQISKLLSDQPAIVEEITEKLSKKHFWKDEAREPIKLGNSSIKVSTVQFGAWSPPEKNFTQGEYLRQIWSNIYNMS